MNTPTFAGRTPYVIAEAGVNHNGRFDLACDLVRAAKAAGADAVKFQTFVPEAVIQPTAPRAKYQEASPGEGDGMLDMVKPLALSFDDFRRLRTLCDDIGIDFMSTPFDRESARFLVELGLPFIKISSGDLDNYSLLEAVADAPGTLILSTGMADLEDIEQALAYLRARRAGAVALLHCVSSYPAPAEDANVSAVATLAEEFGLPTGYSDHTTGFAAACAAVALGACIVEKHFTLDKALPGPDHAFSLSPAELQAFTAQLRETAASLGDGVKLCLPVEVELKTLARRSLYAARDLKAGEEVAPDDVLAMRPATGLAASLYPRLLGQRLGRDIRRLEAFQAVDIEGAA
ncbi:N-acetylneuraminate synthase family protein [Ramlibacter sp. WS9]|uniref:N-acetylneuraminate synthase family protein n=1 Tax=Ramlibacter sp. WS9 TaxID=1882741 RepID=UPI0011419B31|nr:N-acetylneuraminate synthase family protein [Ramlibacter sp. WS9]ROZ63661.1 N-acetylneuraminate synthase [Ramlibacter sp. WS9]